MYTRLVESNDALNRALGHGPGGPTYEPPRSRKPTILQRIKARAWYRWGWGHRPSPNYVLPPRGRHETTAQQRRRGEVDGEAA